MTEKNLRLGRDLIRMLTELEENNALAEVRRLLANGVDPLLIVEWSQEGMRNVGRRYEDGKYFISALIMAGEILYQVLSMVRPIMSERIQVSSHSGRILVGTVQGDIHDIGKNIFAMLLSCHGFEVMDLGVDVPPGDFVTRAFEFRPNVVAMSSLLTTQPHIAQGMHRPAQSPTRLQGIGGQNHYRRRPDRRKHLQLCGGRFLDPRRHQWRPLLPETGRPGLTGEAIRSGRPLRKRLAADLPRPHTFSWILPVLLFLKNPRALAAAGESHLN